MAAGDVANFGPSSIANGSYLALQPTAGVEVTVNNFSYSGAMELYYWDGTTEIKSDEDASPGSRHGEVLRCTNAKYYRIKNVSGASINIAADGVTTK